MPRLAQGEIEAGAKLFNNVFRNHSHYRFDDSIRYERWHKIRCVKGPRE